eukprot:5885324-Amphidinium_carterae.1
MHSNKNQRNANAKHHPQHSKFSDRHGRCVVGGRGVCIDTPSRTDLTLFCAWNTVLPESFRNMTHNAPHIRRLGLSPSSRDQPLRSAGQTCAG